MYEQFFGFSRRPFLPAPSVDCVLEHSGYRSARDTLVRCLADGTGTAVLTAPAGMGKSLLCQDIQRRLSDSFLFAYLCSGQFPNRKSLFQAILFELELEFHGLTDDEARLRVLEAAREAAGEGHGLVVIVDEAHLMSSELLEELRTLAEPSSANSNPLRLMLSAQIEFEERLADRSLDSLKQRIGCHVVLEPLSREESREYISHRLAIAGGELDAFSADAQTFIVRVCDGNPRCLNQLCDHALLSAYTADEQVVSLTTSRSALDDLRSLPLHWNDVGLMETDAESVESSDDDIGESASVETSEAATPEAESIDRPQSDLLESYDPSLVGIVEIGSDIESPTTIPEETTLFHAVDPWPSLASNSREDSAEPEWRHEAEEETFFMPSASTADDGIEDEECFVEDLYARIDHQAQAQFGKPVPHAPDLMEFLVHFAGGTATQTSLQTEAVHGDEHADCSDACCQPDAESLDEVTLLETIRDLQSQLRQVAEPRKEDFENSVLDFQSRYDVCEPETETESSIPEEPPEIVQAPVAAAMPASQPSSEPKAAEAEGRFARLFTRLRQQRRTTRERLASDTDII